MSIGDAGIDSRSFDGIYQEPLGSLIFARIVTNFKLSHIMGQTVMKHIQVLIQMLEGEDEVYLLCPCP